VSGVKNTKSISCLTDQQLYYIRQTIILATMFLTDSCPLTNVQFNLWMRRFLPEPFPSSGMTIRKVETVLNPNHGRHSRSWFLKSLAEKRAYVDNIYSNG